MLSRLASRGSYGWLFAGGLVAGIVGAIALQLATPTPTPTPRAHTRCGLAATDIRPVVTTCSPEEELIRATAVIHYFDNEVQYATADDPMGLKAGALLSLPMMCTSEHSYPALSKHVESAAMVALERGDKETAMRLVEVGRAYDVDDRMLGSLVSAIVKK